MSEEKCRNMIKTSNLIHMADDGFNETNSNL